MTHRTAFLPLDTWPEATPEAGVRAALGLAQALGFGVHALAFTVEVPPVATPLGGFLINVEGMARAAEERSRDAAARMADLVAQAAPGARVELRAAGLGGTLEAAAAEARLHDLAILPWTGGPGVAQDMAQSLVFGSGRPVILVPEGTVAAPLAHLAVAWDGSRAAARALADSLPLLAPGGRISVLAVQDEKALAGAGQAAQLTAALTARGHAAGLVALSAGGRPVADVLQDGALAAGAGLLAMGGFGHSRLRDFVLGGATKAILQHLRMPVLLSH
jgi:nucleotide-binding universal stress UspA family protein